MEDVDNSSEELKEWQRAYGDWYTGYPSPPEIGVRLAKASALAGYKLKPKNLLPLESRRAFLTYCGDVIRTDVASARKLAEDEAYRTIQQWIEMKDLAHKAGDYKEFAKFANPILDRLWPKHHEGETRPPSVVINMAGSFAAEMIQTGGDLKEETKVLLLAKPE